MTDTKEKILTIALRLFAKDGYEAVSVSAIAGELGITKGALYRHYENKRAIFEAIVERMYRLDAERSRRYEVPEETYESAPAAYENVSMDSVRKFALAQYAFWTEDEFARDFRKMLSLERYRDKEMGALYNGCIAAGPLAYLEDIFRGMAARGLLKNAAPKRLALEFYAPLYLLISIADATGESSDGAERLKEHVEKFIRCNAVEGYKRDEAIKE